MNLKQNKNNNKFLFVLSIKGNGQIREICEWNDIKTEHFGAMGPKIFEWKNVVSFRSTRDLKTLKVHEYVANNAQCFEAILRIHAICMLTMIQVWHEL